MNQQEVEAALLEVQIDAVIEYAQQCREKSADLDAMRRIASLWEEDFDD